MPRPIFGAQPSRQASAGACDVASSRSSLHRSPAMRSAAALFRALFLMAASVTAVAQPLPKDWPNRPIHVVVPSPPGGPPDLNMRMLAPHLAQELGQPVVI